MQVFLVVGLPLGFLFLVLALYPREELIPTKRSYLLGLTVSIPVFLAARILGLVVAPLYGSLLLVIHEWADRILPYSVLPLASYLIFYRFERGHPAGLAERRLTAFYAGALSPVGIGEMARSWGNPEPYVLLMLPFFLAAIVLALPNLALRAYGSFGSRLVFLIVAAIIGSVAASFGPWLFLSRLWPLAWLLAAAVGIGAWFLASPALFRRHVPPVD